MNSANNSAKQLTRKVENNYMNSLKTTETLLTLTRVFKETYYKSFLEHNKKGSKKV